MKNSVPCSVGVLGGGIEVGGAGVAGIGEHLARSLAGVGDGLFGHRHQRAHIGGVGAHLGGHDHLMIGIHHGRGVVALVKGPVAGEHDLANPGR